MSFHPLIYKLVLNVFTVEGYEKALNMLPYGLYPAPNYQAANNYLNENNRKDFYKNLIFRDIPFLVYNNNKYNKTIGSCHLIDFDKKRDSNNSYIKFDNKCKTTTVANKNIFEKEKRKMINPNVPSRKNMPPNKRQRIHTDLLPPPSPSPQVSNNPFEENSRTCLINNQTQFNTQQSTPVIGTFAHTSSQSDKIVPIDIINISEESMDGIEHEFSSEMNMPPIARLQFDTIQYTISDVPDVTYDIKDIWDINEFNISQADLDLATALLNNNFGFNDTNIQLKLSEITKITSSEFSDIKLYFFVPFLTTYRLQFHQYLSINAFLDCCKPIALTLNKTTRGTKTNKKSKNNGAMFGYIAKKMLLMTNMYVNKTNIKELDTIKYDESEFIEFNNKDNHVISYTLDELTFKNCSTVTKENVISLKQFNNTVSKIKPSKYCYIEFITDNTFNAYECSYENNYTYRKHNKIPLFVNNSIKLQNNAILWTIDQPINE